MAPTPILKIRKVKIVSRLWTKEQMSLRKYTMTSRIRRRRKKSRSRVSPMRGFYWSLIMRNRDKVYTKKLSKFMRSIRDSSRRRRKKKRYWLLSTKMRKALTRTLLNRITFS